MTIRNVQSLPLLGAFDAIMTRGSITAAAEALNVTQSAVSKQLAQLREWLGDELFVRTSDGMEPTPHALAMREQVRSILDQAAELTSAVVTPPGEFTGRFVLSAGDEVLARFLPRLVDRLDREAPRLRLVTLPLARDYRVRQLETGQVHLVVAVNWNAPELLMQRRLGRDDFVCVLHEKHPLARGNLTLKRYIGATHVLVAPFGGEKGVVDIELERLGKERRVCASVSGFHMVDGDLLGTSRLATLPAQVAQTVARKGPFVIKRVPLKLPPSEYHALWHPRFSSDPRLRWMLDAVTEGFRGRG